MSLYVGWIHLSRGKLQVQLPTETIKVSSYYVMLFRETRLCLNNWWLPKMVRDLLQLRLTSFFADESEAEDTLRLWIVSQLMAPFTDVFLIKRSLQTCTNFRKKFFDRQSWTWEWTQLHLGAHIYLQEYMCVSPYMNNYDLSVCSYFSML